MMLRTPPPSKRPRASSPEAASHLLPLQTLSPGLPAFANEGTHLQYDCDDPQALGDSLRCTYKCKQLVKAELLESHDDQERKILELTSQLRILESSSRAVGLERDNLLERVKRLEQEEAASAGRERAVQERYKLDLSRSEEKFIMQLKRCEDLELKLQQQLRLCAEAESKADAASREVEDLKVASAKSMEKLKREVAQLEEQLRRTRKDSQFTVLKTEAKISEEKSKLQYAESEVNILKDQCEDLQNLLSRCTEEKRSLLQELAVATVENPSSHKKEEDMVIKHLRDELKSLKSAVAEAQVLKQFHDNVTLLKEKLESERLRAERAEAALEDLANADVQLKRLNMELQSWRSLIDEIPGVEGRDDIPRKVRELQRELLALTAEVGMLTGKVTELQSEIEKEESKRNINCESVRNSKVAVGDMDTENKRLKRQVDLLKKEISGLKSILSSYEEEEALLMSMKSHEANQTLDSREKVKEVRVQVLETLVEDLQREGDLLRAEIANSELKLGRGDYDPSCTKVVHMVENLDVNADKKVLLAEIQSLQEKVKALENETFHSASLNAATKSAELSVLRDQVSSLEKREARYKKVFAEKISVFRQACFLLFGYSVEMSEEQQSSTGMTVTLFSLQSKYAQSEDEVIVFQFQSNRMDLLDNEYVSSPDISRMVDIYLKKFKSIPAFTANLTSELFNKHTIG